MRQPVQHSNPWTCTICILHHGTSRGIVSRLSSRYGSFNPQFPYLNNFSLAKSELEWFTRLTGIELFLIGGQTTHIVHTNILSGLDTIGSQNIYYYIIFVRFHSSKPDWYKLTIYYTIQETEFQYYSLPTQQYLLLIIPNSRRI